MFRLIMNAPLVSLVDTFRKTTNTQVCGEYLSGPAGKCLDHKLMDSYLRPKAQWQDGVFKGRVSVHVRRNAWKYQKHVGLR